MVSKHSSVRSIRLQNEAWEWLAKEAERRGTTVNGVVAELVEREQFLPLKAARNSGPDGMKVAPKPDSAVGKLQPVDALTGKPIEARKPMQKMGKGKK